MILIFGACLDCLQREVDFSLLLNIPFFYSVISCIFLESDVDALAQVERHFIFMKIVILLFIQVQSVSENFSLANVKLEQQ